MAEHGLDSAGAGSALKTDAETVASRSDASNRVAIAGVAAHVVSRDSCSGRTVLSQAQASAAAAEAPPGADATLGWRAGAPFTAGTPNFEVAMREWNHSEVYRKTIVLMAQRLGGG